jgi:hypothetical protein
MIRKGVWLANRSGRLGGRPESTGDDDPRCSVCRFNRMSKWELEKQEKSVRPTRGLGWQVEFTQNLRVSDPRGDQISWNEQGLRERRARGRATAVAIPPADIRFFRHTVPIHEQLVFSLPFPCNRETAAPSTRRRVASMQHTTILGSFVSCHRPIARSRCVCVDMLHHLCTWLGLPSKWDGSKAILWRRQMFENIYHYVVSNV